MTVSAVSHYRGGTIDVVAPLAKTLKAVYRKHGVGYRLSRFESGPNVGDWLVVVQYADMTAYEKALASFCRRPRMAPGRDRHFKGREADQPGIGHRSRSLTQPGSGQAFGFFPSLRAAVRRLTFSTTIGLVRAWWKLSRTVPWSMKFSAACWVISCSVRSHTAWLSLSSNMARRRSAPVMVLCRASFTWVAARCTTRSNAAVGRGSPGSSVFDIANSLSI